MPLHINKRSITETECDAIVKLGGKSPLFKGGADRYVNIVTEEIQNNINNEAQEHQAGRVKIRSGGKLPCRYVIKAKAPVLTGVENIDTSVLEAFYRSSLKLAVEHGCESVAVPLIAAHGYGYCEAQLIRTVTEIISSFLLKNEMTVYLCVSSSDTYEPSGELYTSIKRFIDAEFEDEKAKLFSMPCLPKQSDSRSDIPPLGGGQTKRVFSEPSRQVRLPEPLQQMSAPSYDSMQAMPTASIEEWLKKKDESFAVTLLKLIDRKGMTDVECYKKANVGKKTFWKINNQQDYRPSKQTVIAFAIALELTFDETQQLLRTVGFSLSHSSKADLIIEYFIVHGNYDIFEINEALFRFDELTLGC